ncbi:MAG: hypothetical protein ABR498_00275 [Candidatus Dormibacteria bacterium]
MHRTNIRRGLVVSIAMGAAVLGASATQARASSPLDFSLTNISSFAGEPSITSAPDGTLYAASLLALQPLRSPDGASGWSPGKNLDGTGDDCVATDQAGSLYMCNLAGSQSNAPLQADVWKTKDPHDDAGATWIYGNNPINVGGNQCGTDCNPFGVDRPWVDASIPANGTTDNAVVALMYHDFYGPSRIWVNISTNGGASFGLPIDVQANFTIPNGVAGAAVAAADSACNTIPAGVAIAKGGPHVGRIYVAWEAADPQSLGTGCNISEQQPFHNLIVAWSDNNGSTWTPQLAIDLGEAHDAATPFVAFTLDNQGNPYIAYDADPGFSPASCAPPDSAGGCPTNSNSEYDTYVVWSSDGGPNWDGGTGLVPGSAASAYKVNADTGTHQFPAIAAGDPGKVDVAYLGTPSFEDVFPNGKLDNTAGGCGAGGPNVPAQGCTWSLWIGQSLNLTQPVATATFTHLNATSTPMHVGDICDVGIACLGGRNLADFIMGTVSPTTGCFHVAYADDHVANAVRSADQLGGPSIIGTGDCGQPLAVETAEAAWAGLLVPAALVAGGAAWALRRRRNTRTD